MSSFANPYILISWSLVAFILYLKWRGYFKPKKFWFFGPFTTLVYSILLLLVFMATFSWLAKSPKHTNFNEQLAFVKQNKDIIGEVDLLIKQDSLNPGKLEWGLQLIDAYVKIPNDLEYWKYQQRRGKYRDKLISQIVLGNECEKSQAIHLLTYWYLKTENYIAAKHFIEQQANCHSEGFFLLAAKTYYALGEKDISFQYFLKSLDTDKKPDEAFSLAYKAWGYDTEKSGIIINHHRAIMFFDFSALRNYFLERGDWVQYFYSLYFGILFRYHPFFVLISFLIVASIGYYLYQIDIFKRDSAKRLFYMFIFGCAIVPLSLFIYDMYGHGWNWFSPFVHGTWSYMIFGVGLNEEFIKISVFLVAVYLLKWADEPIDYIIYAAMGALAFAFLENTIYFHKTDGNVVFARTLFSTLGHVFDSCIIGYGLAMSRFRYKNKIPVIVLFPLLLFLAAFWHGSFNTILFLKLGLVTFIVFIPFSIVMMALLGGMVNNAMNNSPHFDAHKINDNDKSINFIATSFVLLYIVQQVINIYLNLNIDAMAANMVNTVALVGVIIIILAYYLGTFDVVRGQWISFIKMITKRRINRNVALQVNCKIYTDKIDRIEYISDYLFGKIEERLVIDNDDAFFLVNLITPYTFEDLTLKKIIVRHIEPRQRIRSGIRFRVRLIVPLNDEIAFDHNNSRENFEFVGNALLECPEELQGLNFEALDVL